MRSIILTATVLLIAASHPVVAQQSPKRQPPPFPADWTTQHNEITQMLTFAANNLELDDHQRAQFEQASEEQNRRFKEAQRLHKEMDEALRSENQEEISRISEEIQSQDSPWGVFLDATDELDQCLSKPQRQVFEELVSDTQWLSDRSSELARLGGQVTRALDLDGSQQKNVQRLLDRQQKLLNDRYTEMRALCHDIFEALVSEDEQAQREFHQTLEQLRHTRPEIDRQLFDSLGTTLTDEQKQLLDGFIADFHTASAKTKADIDEVRFILMAIRKISIKPSQKQKLLTIRRETIRQLDRLQRNGTQNNDDLAVSLQQKVKSVLIRKQMKQLEVTLEAIREHADRMRFPDSTSSSRN